MKTVVRSSFVCTYDDAYNSKYVIMRHKTMEWLFLLRFSNSRARFRYVRTLLCGIFEENCQYHFE